MRLQLSDPRITLREVRDEDSDFLLRVYASTREQELQASGWNEEQKRSFVAMQFAAQQRAYRSYPAASFFVLCQDGDPVGRVYLQQAETLHIIDLSLLAQYRGHGIGSAILRAVQQRAAEEGKAASICVERLNPALRLYRRLGFQPVEDKGVYWRMAWRPESLSLVR